ncbi:hypothetical protein ACFLZB_00110 [Nanoarchaeota archaeon]
MIELQGYEQIVDGAVYSQQTEDFQNHMVVVLGLYQEKIKREVFQYLGKKCAQFSALSSLGEKPRTDLENLMDSLSPEQMTGFISQDEDFFESIKDQIVSDDEEGLEIGRILEVTYGVVPTEKMETAPRDVAWFHASFLGGNPQEGVGLVCSLALRFENGSLPPKRDMMTLAYYEVTHSRAMCIYPDGYDQDAVQDLIENVYSSLSPDQLEEDIRRFDGLEPHSISTLSGLIADEEIEEEELPDFS